MYLQFCHKNWFWRLLHSNVTAIFGWCQAKARIQKETDVKETIHPTAKLALDQGLCGEDVMKGRWKRPYGNRKMLLNTNCHYTKNKLQIDTYKTSPSYAI